MSRILKICIALILLAFVGVAGAVSPRLSVTENCLPIFTTITPTSSDFLYDRRWNLLRMTARGVDPVTATYSILVTPDAMNIFIR